MEENENRQKKMISWMDGKVKVGEFIARKKYPRWFSELDQEVKPIDDKTKQIVLDCVHQHLQNLPALLMCFGFFWIFIVGIFLYAQWYDHEFNLLNIIIVMVIMTLFEGFFVCISIAEHVITLSSINNYCMQEAIFFQQCCGVAKDAAAYYLLYGTVGEDGQIESHASKYTEIINLTNSSPYKFTTRKIILISDKKGIIRYAILE